ncbi:MAG: hypothetical protein QOF19_3609 [Alphaproteobacteria bacterium]|nr:hypothetical protein [Alphaproteobacteria bacterium]
MLIFDAGKIVRAVTDLRWLEAELKQLPKANEGRANKETRKRTIATLQEVAPLVVAAGARVTAFGIAEVIEDIKKNKNYTPGNISNRLVQLNVTLRRELSLMKSFCVEPAKESFFATAGSSFGDDFEKKFPSAIYELDEAGKCLALSRGTACVFHMMRMMEIGIRAVARCLSIPDPLKPAERNWGAILRTIKDARDGKSTAKNWKGKDKEDFEDFYASLDAVRVAWRNPTMHVENKYTDDEAEHVFVAVRGFMKKLSSRADEEGKPLA